MDTSFVPELHETLERIDLALEGADVGVWDWDPRDDSVRFDRRWCEMIGLDPERTPMRFETWKTLVHPEDLPACMSAVMAHLGGYTPRYEALHRVRHADGCWRFILARGRISARDAEGRPTRVTGTHLDLTGTALGRRTLADQLAWSADLMESSPYATALLDVAQRYVAASARWCEEFGLDQGRVAGTPFRPGPGATRPDWSAVMTKVISTGIGSHEEEELTKAADGTERWIRWSAQPWRHEKVVRGVLLNLEDITAAVQARHLRETDLESRLAELSTFAGHLAQELKTPLQVIGMAGTALERAIRDGNRDPAKLVEGTRALAEMTRRASSVATALRTLAQRGRAAPAEQVTVAELFANAAALMTGRFQQGGVALVFENASHGRPAGRPADLMRIVMDLLEQAYESAHEAEPATERWVRMEARDEEGRMVIRCSHGGALGAPATQAGIDSPVDPISGPGQRAVRIARVLAERSGGSVRALAGAAHHTIEARLPLIG